MWKKSLANEFGRLAQGVSNRIDGTSTMYFIPKEEVPFTTKKVTYPKIVCNIRPNKADTHRTRITVGGNLLDYAGNSPRQLQPSQQQKLYSTVSCPPQNQNLPWPIKQIPQQRSTRSIVYEIPHINYTTGNHRQI